MSTLLFLEEFIKLALQRYPPRVARVRASYCQSSLLCCDLSTVEI